MKITTLLLAVLVIAFSATSRAQTLNVHPSIPGIVSFDAMSLAVGSDNYAGGAGQGIQIVGFETGAQSLIVGVTPFQVVPGLVGAGVGTWNTISHGGFSGIFTGQGGVGTPVTRLSFNLNANSSETILGYPNNNGNTTATLCTRVYASSVAQGFTNISLRAWVSSVPYTSATYAGSSPTLTFTVSQTTTVTIEVDTTWLAQWGITPAPSIMTQIIDHGAPISFTAGSNVGVANRVMAGPGSFTETLEPGTYTLIVNGVPGNASANGDVLISVNVDS